MEIGGPWLYALIAFLIWLPMGVGNALIFSFVGYFYFFILYPEDPRNPFNPKT